MKLTKYEFQWFEKEDRRRRCRACVGRDGMLRLGQVLRQALPPAIRLGFDARQKVLAIAAGRDGGLPLPKYGVLPARALSAQIVSTGLRLPLSFLFERDEATGYFLGRVLPRRRRAAGAAQGVYDAEQLLILYRHVVDLAVGALAKSTPLEERILAEQFLSSLSPQERALARLLLEGRPLEEISASLRLPVARLTAMGREIGRKRQLFCADP